jgi:twitching motility two-component system response regulator PilG
LTQHISQSSSGCLQIFSGGNVWLLHLDAGKLVYASDLTDPFGRLDRQLRQLQLPTIRSAVRVQVRILFETPTVDEPAQDNDYRAICWLVEQEHITPEQAAHLIEQLANDVLEALLPIQSGNFEFAEQDLLSQYPKFCQLDLQALLATATHKVRQRQTQATSISTPSERVNFAAQPGSSSPLPFPRLLQQPMGTPTPPFPTVVPPSQPPSGTTIPLLETHAAPLSSPAFNHFTGDPTRTTEPLIDPSSLPDRLSSRLAAALNSGITDRVNDSHSSTPDSTQSAPSIPSAPSVPSAHLAQPTDSPQSTSLPTPQPPIAPSSSSTTRSANYSTVHAGSSTEKPVGESKQNILGDAKRISTAAEKTYTVACIDDSPTVLQAIESFLDDRSLSVVLISDPVKALMQIIRSKPDLILLDVTMPNLDGYELCSLLRKHPTFRETPIIMVTGKTGFIDRAKAKLVGASGYLTKPFTQPDLLKLVFKHLS